MPARGSIPTQSGAQGETEVFSASRSPSSIADTDRSAFGSVFFCVGGRGCAAPFPPCGGIEIFPQCYGITRFYDNAAARHRQE